MSYRRPAKPIHAPERVLLRVWQYVAQREDDECWPWTASKGSHGYGQIGWEDHGFRTMMTAHRVVWESAYGPIPEGLTVDHLCRNRVCANPAHLRLLSNIENATDNGRWNAAKTHCPQGHAYDDKNTYIDPRGGRTCRICRRRIQSEYQQRKKAEARQVA